MAQPSWTKSVFIWTDGASRGNPGPSALGIHVLNDKKQLIYEKGVYLKKDGTNNFAEYSAVVYALKLSVRQKVQRLSLFSDSELLIRQLKGEYRVKSLSIKPLFQECLKWMQRIPSVSLIHIPRAKNMEADRLANQALDLHIQSG